MINCFIYLFIAVTRQSASEWQSPKQMCRKTKSDASTDSHGLFCQPSRQELDCLLLLTTTRKRLAAEPNRFFFCCCCFTFVVCFAKAKKFSKARAVVPKDIERWACPGGRWRGWGSGAWSGWCSAGGCSHTCSRPSLQDSTHQCEGRLSFSPCLLLLL